MTFTADDGNVGAGATVTDFDESSTTVIIPNTVAIDGTPYAVTTIGQGVFSSNALTSVTIGDSVTGIGNFAFASNSGLASAVFEGPPPTTFTAAVRDGSLGDGVGLAVSYPYEYDAANYPDGYTTPTWQGYATTTTIPSLTVTFDSAGGSGVAGQTVDYGDPATEPPAPTRTGFDFAGWYTEATDGTQWGFSRPVTENMTLEAHWKAVAVPAGTSTASGLANTGSSLGAWPLAGFALLLVGSAAQVLRRRGKHLPR